MHSSLDFSVLVIILFLAATFAAALVAGLAGFAFGLVAAAVWLLARYARAFANGTSELSQSEG